jgi:hypothetical protein
MMWYRLSIWRYRVFSAVCLSYKSIPIPIPISSSCPSPWPCSCPCLCPWPCVCQCPCQYPCPRPCQFKYGAVNDSVRHGNYIVNSQGSYEVAQKLKESLTWECIGKIRWKISAPLPLRQTYRLIPLSAKSISLDSPFKNSGAFFPRDCGIFINRRAGLSIAGWHHAVWNKKLRVFSFLLVDSG